MKKYIGILAVFFVVLAACKEDKVVFDVPVPEEGIRFEPVSGGAIMHYTLPKNTDICAICARYENDRGEEVTMLGTPFVDSILLTGFNAPATNVPVRLTVTDNNNVESAPVMRTFNTLASAPFAFIDSVEVFGSWGGFYVESSYTGDVSGIVDVYYVGENPYTKEIDTLFIQNFSIQAGQVTTNIALENGAEETTLVLKTEDSKGNYVRTKVVPGLRKYDMELYPGDKWKLSDPGNFSDEYQGGNDNPSYNYCTMFGLEFLKDGDKTGSRRLERGEWNEYYYTYLTKTDGGSYSYVQVEFDEPQVVASVRLYGIVKNRALMDDFFGGYVSDYLPCHVKILASNDPDLPDEQWVELADFVQSDDANSEGCWGNHELINTSNMDDYKNVEPYYANVVCAVEATAYKYIRVVSLDHFRTYTESAEMYGNTEDRISYHELEVYVQKK